MASPTVPVVAEPRGLALGDSVSRDATLSNHRENVGRFRMMPVRSIGIGTRTSLKASFWRTDLEDTSVDGDPDYGAVMVHFGGGGVWRNAGIVPGEIGSMSGQPLETTRWRLEGMVSFAHIFVPVALMGQVSASLSDRDFSAENIALPWASRDERLFAAVSDVQPGLLAGEPNGLLLDSWALILSEILVRCFSSHSRRYARLPNGGIPARGIALVADYVEAHIDRDLDLSELASVAAMSLHHFVRRFRATVGITPHASVLSRRVRRAQALLEGPGSSLAEIAIARGFSSQGHLTTTFRAGPGVTPGHYRRMQLGL